MAKNKENKERNQNDAANRDNNTTGVGEAVGTAGGGLTGAAVGSVFGPLGTIAGGIAGAALGNKAGENIAGDDEE